MIQSENDEAGYAARFLRKRAVQLLIVRDGVLRQTMAQSAGNYVGSLLLMVRAFLLARLLSPSEFGLVALVSLVTSYASFSDVGTSVAMAQLVPEAPELLT